jgi:TonB family protein
MARGFKAQGKQRAASALLRTDFTVGFFLVAVMKGNGGEIVLRDYITAAMVCGIVFLRRCMQGTGVKIAEMKRAVGMRRWVALALVGVIGCGAAGAQQGAVAGADAEIVAASLLVGKGLFLRGFYLNNDLTYDAAGRVQGSPKVGDWTVAAVNVLKAERRGTDEIELDGVRAAIRYNPDTHEFQRHPLNDEKMRLVVKGAGDAKQLEAAFAAMFAVGIDPALQRSMPDYWRHYFDPALAWPEDGLQGQTIYALYGGADQAKDVVAPKVEHRVDAKYDDFAVRDKVQGAILLRVVVDSAGVPQRIAIARPLGYGLDASAVEAMRKWRFSAGTRGGTAVAVGVVVEEDFNLAAGR